MLFLFTLVAILSQFQRFITFLLCCLEGRKDCDDGDIIAVKSDMNSNITPWLWRQMTRSGSQRSQFSGWIPIAALIIDADFVEMWNVIGLGI